MRGGEECVHRAVLHVCVLNDHITDLGDPSCMFLWCPVRTPALHKHLHLCHLNNYVG